MIKTIVPFLFALSAGNRLLLQVPPIPPPPAVMEPPANMLPGGMVNPGATPSNPAAPVDPLPAAPAEPVVPGGAVTTPGSAPGSAPAAVPPPPANPLPPVPNQGTPGAPIPGAGPAPGTGGGALPWTNPNVAGPTGPGLAGNRLECVKTPTATDPGCSGQILTVNNPNLNWELKASAVGAMYRSTVNIDFAQFSMVPEELKGFWFTNAWSGAGAVININNNSGRTVRIAEMRCEKDHACQDLTLYLGSDSFIEQGDVHCTTYLACNNCWIKENAMDVGKPCTAYVEPI